MPISAGTKLGPFEIVAPLGAGGMGEVYRAKDSKLKREVALKVLPEAFARDPERMARFRREAEVLASLNHPHVAQIYAVEQGALVMELVDGPTLAERITAAPIPMEEALLIARQIAEALECAHEKGIIHRDLKPANVKLTADGQVKLLDFGLAKALEGRAPIGDQANLSTVTTGPSVAGAILGTAGYMSPEQARGEALDRRTDIWAFGVMLYEMLTRRPLFSRKSTSDTLAAVLREDPDWTALPPGTPSPIRRMLRRCLERERGKRLHDIADARLEIDEALAGGSELSAAPARHKRGWAPWMAALAGCVVAAAVSLVHFREAPATLLPARHFSFAPESLDAATSFARRAVISPNAKHIAYIAQRKLWIKDLDREEARQLSGGDDAVGPFWSPDSEFVGFAAGQFLKKISVHGGAAITLCKLSGNYRGGAWSPDGRSIVYSLAGLSLLEIPAKGGASKVALPIVEGAYPYAPHFLPSTGGQRLVVFGSGSQTKQRIEVVNLATGERRELHEGAYGIYSASGHILFQTSAMEAGMWALPFSLSTGKPTGEAFPVVQQGGEWSLADDGTLVYVDFSHAQSLQLIWRDRAGNKVGQIGQPQMAMRGMELSPDGERVAVSAQEQGNLDIWIHQVASPIKTRLTFGPTPDGYPTWSPSGREVVFHSTGSGNQDMFIQAADIIAEPRPLAASPELEQPTGWSPDGSTMVFMRVGPKTGNDLWYLKRKPDGSFSEPVPFLQTPFNERVARISPNGRFVAYESDESGRLEVFVRPFPVGEGKSQVSTNGGLQPRWRRDGKELFYLEGETLVAAPVSIAESFSNGAPTRLFRDSALRGLTTSMYDVAADGRRFVMTQPLEGEKSKPASIHIVQNWQEAFRGRQSR